MATSSTDRYLNAELVSEIGPLLSARDRHDIADWWGVDVRTAQRWFTSAAEQRAFISRAGQVDRREWAKTLLYGYDFGKGPGDREWTQKVTSLPDAFRFIESLKDGSAGVWMSRSARHAQIGKAGGRWYVIVTYHYEDTE